MTVAELLDRISSRELSEWMAFDRIEPVGDRRLDVLAAMVMCLLANVNRNPKKRKKPYQVDEFLPPWAKDAPEQDGASMLRIVEMLNTAMGGKDLRPDVSKNPSPDSSIAE